MVLRDSLVGSRFLAAAAARPADRAWITLVQADGSEQQVLPAQLVAAATNWARLLVHRGLGRADRVAICLDHSLDLYAAFLGAMLAGGVPSFFAPRSVKQKKEEQERVFQTLLAQSGSRVLICNDAGFAALAAGYVVLDPAEVSLDAAVPALDMPQGEPADVAFIQYSSGTTGLKKGVAITHAMLLDQIEAYAGSIALTPEDVICSWLPLYHDMGLITAFFLPLLKGVSVVALSPFDWVRQPALLLTAIARHRATLCWQPNFAYKFLARTPVKVADLLSMRLWINCSEPVLAESHDAFFKAFARYGMDAKSLGACYAMAEAVFAVTSTGPSQGGIVAADGRQFVSSGRPLPGVSIRILDDGHRSLPENAVGEIAIRTPSLFSDYVGDVRAGFSDSHFLTGDTGFISGGELYVLARVKDVIIVAGRNLYPQDIEAAIDDVAGAIPGRCVAFGVPNVELGTESLVIIMESHDASAAGIAAMSAAVARRVMAFAGVTPGDIVVKPHMWLTKATSGKISRQINRTRYLEEQGTAAAASAVAVPLAAEDADAVMDLVRFAVRATITRSRRNADILGDTDSFFDLGLVDSLSFVDLLAELEDCFGLPVPHGVVNDADRHDSIAALAAAYRAAGIAGASDSAGQRRADGNLLVGARERRMQLAPQFADSDRVDLVPVPYVMYTPQPDYVSPSANTDDMGFRLSYKNGQKILRPKFARMPGAKGVILGNSVCWGTGATHDTKVVHNALNERMPDATWYSYALRLSTFTQERLAGELFAPLDATHVVWISGMLMLHMATSNSDHRNLFPYPRQAMYEKLLGATPQGNLPGFEQRLNEIRVLLDRELALYSRVFRKSARNLVFALQPKLHTCGKALHPAELELAQLFDIMPGTLKDPKQDADRALDLILRKDARVLCERHGIQFIDMDSSPRLRTPDWLFVDAGHMTDAGHAALAGIIMDNLK